jgi:hypothetical protein
MKPSEAKIALTHLTEQKRPAFVWGAPGIGKSELMAQIASDTKRELRDVRMSMMDTVDVRGFPVPDMQAQVMRWLTADFLPPMKISGKPNKTKGILFLDEMNSAVAAVQATGYQLILNRRVGEYVLPEGWAVHAAGNRTSDRSIVHQQPAALANRFVHIDLNVDIDDWMEWAAANGVSEVTRGFIKFRPGLLHDFDAASNPRAFPSPRSWRFVDNIFRQGLPSAVERELIKGTVGEGATAEYLQFATVYRDLPTVEEIMLNPDSAPVPDDSNPAAQYAVCTMLDTKANAGNMGRIHTYVARMRTEFQVFFMRSASRVNREIQQTKEFKAWVTKHQDILI